MLSQACERGEADATGAAHAVATIDTGCLSLSRFSILSNVTCSLRMRERFGPPASVKVQLYSATLELALGELAEDGLCIESTGTWFWDDDLRPLSSCRG